MSVTLRQMRSVVAVFEEGSFTRAAERENATQSGISQHVAAVEGRLGARLFERDRGQVTPTPSGRRFYARAIEALRQVELAVGESADAPLAGPVRAGLMPAFTRAALAPALADLADAHPEIEITVTEGYSGTLTDLVRAEALDFAFVPAFEGAVGLTVSYLLSDDEVLVTRPGHPLAKEGGAASVGDLGPIKLVVPGAANVRRARLEEYLATHGARVEQRVALDTMTGTLALVAETDWVTIFPRFVLMGAQSGCVATRLADPFVSKFVAIEPSRKPLGPGARLFLERLADEVRRLAGQ